jgi:[3-methyl-2-oxobutanoate dehydrogenase (acetyl-transferring)] kinase
LQLLPHIVVSNPHINNVYRAYHYAFETLKNHPPVETLKDNETFSSLLRRLVDEHSPLLDSLASGLRDCKRKPHVGGRLHLDGFLESMLRSRISRRVIAEQHLGLGQPRPGYVGIICTELSLADSVDLAAQRCRQVCIETYGIAPDVVTSGDRDLSMAYIPHHVDYMLYEVLKNAARAVVEHHHHHQQQQQLLPSLLVRICGGDDDVTIRVSDQGGGITKDDLSRVFEYGFTTVDDYSGGGGGGGQQLSILYPPSEGLGDVGISNNNNNSSSNSSSSSSVSAAFNAAEILGTAVTGGGHSRFRMAGLGFGLPLSRLYARYFGGDLTLFSLPGYGVDVYLRLQRLEGTEWAEVTTDDPVTPPLSVSVDTIIDQNSGGGGRSRKVVD